jgi:hypothetical protein
MTLRIEGLMTECNEMLPTFLVCRYGVTGALVLALAALLPGAAHAEEASTTRMSVGGALEGVAYGIPIPTSGRARFDFALDYLATPAVELRLLPSLGLGLGVADDLYFDLSLALSAALRLSPAPVYTIWLGYMGRVGVAAETADAADTVGALSVHGPQLSLASFRFGEDGRFELDHWGELLLPPIWGYGIGLAFRVRVD